MATSRSSELDARSHSTEVEAGEKPDRATPGSDLAAALVIAVFAALAVVFSIRLDVPGSIYTAPGLFPAIIGSTLFVMAAVLGWRAIRAGAKFSAPSSLRALRRVHTFGWFRALRWVRTLGWLRSIRWVRALRRLRAVVRTVTVRRVGVSGAPDEAARTAQLMALVMAYVLLVGLVNFEFALPLGFFTARISSYEVISVIMVAWTLRLFWRAHPARCLIVALVSVEVLAAIFRYGFGIPMPAGY